MGRFPTSPLFERKIMSGTAVGTTGFVLGREQDSNREVRIFTDGQAYDLDVEDIQAYTANDSTFPYPA